MMDVSFSVYPSYFTTSHTIQFFFGDCLQVLLLVLIVSSHTNYV